MKKKILFILAIAISLTVACNKDDETETVPNQIDMTTRKHDVIIRVAGTGTMSINWGDGIENETHELLDYVSKWQNSQAFSHYYSGTTSHTITLEGDQITHLDCFNNEITSLNMSRINTLRYLVCATNKLLKLDIDKNTNLSFLACADNQLTELVVSTAPELNYLSCYNNQIKQLDVSKNTKLVTMYCGPNQLSDLDISKNNELSVLYCGSNRFTSLDVSNHPNLATLICDGNQISNLNVSGCTGLTVLNCGRYTYTSEGLGNRLTDLDVSGCTALTNLNCENNLFSGDGLNILFQTLSDDSNMNGKDILISHNPGVYDCDKSIAEDRGWTVIVRSIEE